MIALYLIAAHFAGDFLLQSRWHAARKLDDVGVRASHVTWYAVAFIPVVAAVAPSNTSAVGFLVWLWVLHFLTDSRRFHSSIGDWLHWNLDRKTRGLRLAPNPWAPMPILIDQSLHLVQLAILGGVFLS